MFHHFPWENHDFPSFSPEKNAKQTFDGYTIPFPFRPMGKAWEKPHFLGLAESQGPNFLRGQPVLGGNGSKKGASGPRKWLRADMYM